MNRKLTFGIAGVGVIGVGAWILTQQGQDSPIAQPVLDYLASIGGLPATDPGTMVQATGYQNGRPIALTLQSIGGGHYLIPSAASAWNQMVADAANDGVQFKINTSFRTADQQSSLLAKLGSYSEGGAANQVGYSPHQEGIALDISVGTGTRGEPGNGPVWDWLVANAGDYGFVNDYLLKPGSGESWHFQRGSSSQSLAGFSYVRGRGLAVYG